MEEGDCRKAECARRGNRHGEYRQAAPVVPVGGVPRGQSEEDIRHGERQTHQPKRRSGAGALVEFPPHGNARHRPAQRDDDAPHHEHPVIAMPERAVGVKGLGHSVVFPRPEGRGYLNAFYCLGTL